ncbi:MAG: DUF362 domain-containing protein [Dehalococcoidales bacterium]|jgi:uncharacterized protein (DUF362 family)/Pyruvate/2-oxoacid:ferredoxin oxidoreductase delta subunit|nr:DUF362 domain-containing protein [Dehalococcoidales bacterium]
MLKSTVAVVGCDTYDGEPVYEAVRVGIDLLGGISRFILPGENIVIKPNVLFGVNPQKCVTTHPSVFQAVGKILREVSVNLSYGDSSGLGKRESNLRKTGLKPVADELGIVIADFSKGKAVTHKEALLNKRFVIANGVLASDGLVSLPKLKTHGITRITGAVKNQFGCVPGILKSQYHVKMPNPYDFATMLVDLTMLVRPRLYIMDGIMAMEGNGPGSGNPKKLGVLLFSSDPVALDAIACKIIDLESRFVPTSEPGERSGLGTYHYENIEVVGDNVDSFVDGNFEVVRKSPAFEPSGPLRTFVKNRICPRPTIDKKVCTTCGTCVEMCPVTPKAVNWHTGDKSGPPAFKYDRCVHCYCCQELCPEGAVTIRDTLLGRLLFR